jgi:hypothetical protein
VNAPFYPLNWFAGWGCIAAAFISGALIGLYFHREDFWGGYASFRRRIVRLGHIALAALGMMNVLFSYSPWPPADSFDGRTASIGFLIGGVSMPAVCFLSGWRAGFRFWFWIPVTSLLFAVGLTLRGGGA